MGSEASEVAREPVRTGQSADNAASEDRIGLRGGMGRAAIRWDQEKDAVEKRRWRRLNVDEDEARSSSTRASARPSARLPLG